VKKTNVQPDEKVFKSAAWTVRHSASFGKLSAEHQEALKAGTNADECREALAVHELLELPTQLEAAQVMLNKRPEVAEAIAGDTRVGYLSKGLSELDETEQHALAGLCRAINFKWKAEKIRQIEKFEIRRQALRPLFKKVPRILNGKLPKELSDEAFDMLVRELTIHELVIWGQNTCFWMEAGVPELATNIVEVWDSLSEDLTHVIRTPWDVLDKFTDEELHQLAAEADEPSRRDLRGFGRRDHRRAGVRPRERLTFVTRPQGWGGLDAAPPDPFKKDMHTLSLYSNAQPEAEPLSREDIYSLR
jgi:hypothetical protein